MALRLICSPSVPGVVCMAIALASVFPAAYDIWKVATIVDEQLRGAAHGTDFLNLYAGASLLLQAPQDAYRFDMQLALQRGLTGRDSFLVPFYLPPYAGLLISWLGWLPYGAAYLVWLIGGLACVLFAAHLIAPRWTRYSAVVWLGLGVLFLPLLLGLAQGQTSALMLLCCAAWVRGLTDRRRGQLPLAFGVLGLTLKPQLAPLFVCSLLVARRWASVVGLAALLGAAGLLAALRIGHAGIDEYLPVSTHKLWEAFGADPGFLLGPTLLHASHWFLGVNVLAHASAAILVSAAVAGLVYVWRQGVSTDDALLLQLAVLPVVAVIAAPYALVYELTLWLVSFWLLLRYTQHRPTPRALLLWLVAGVWVAGNIGVLDPIAGGADVAAILGLCLVAFIAWLSYTHVDLNAGVAPQSRAHIPIA